MIRAYPAVTVLIVTYNRPEEIRKTIAALKKNIVYNGRVLWHIADDGSPGNYIEDLRRDFYDLDLRYSKYNRGGWGRNVNAALRAIPTDFIFLCEDDYVSMLPVDLNTGVALITAIDTIGMVRYDGLEGHDLDIKLRTLKTDGAAEIHYATIENTSPSLYSYSNRPHLLHKRFHHCFGYYPEGISLGSTEESFAHRVRDGGEYTQKIAVLSTGIIRAFDHIGKSYQLTAEDIAR